MKSPFFFVILWIAIADSCWDLKMVRADEGVPLAYKPDSGPHTVKNIKRLALQDAKRGKELQLRIHYPDASGPFPLIVWSHGAGGSKDNYLTLLEHWASHGYVTIQPTHSDSRSLAAKASDPISFRDWQSRPADISFILDSISELEAKEPALRGRMDAKQIGVGGHSFGANTAQLIGGARASVMGGEKSFEDQRVTAIALLSGQGPGEMLTEKSWSNFGKPLLVMTGSADGPTRTGQPAEWRKKPYELSPPGDKYLVWVEGLDHGYGGITGVNMNPKHKPNDDHVRYTKMVTLAFWDAYLKDSSDAKAYLASDRLPSFSKGSLQLKRK
jgi:predicted dienelactone hydrolase